MTVQVIDPEGKEVSIDFMVLKYGVKLDEETGEYFYQGFGNNATLKEDLMALLHESMEGSGWGYMIK